LKFVGVFGGVAEIFWNMTPRHSVVVPDVANQRFGLYSRVEMAEKKLKEKHGISWTTALC
jgi:hypothetical protein